MAKWSMATAGSSCHLHTSLWDSDERRAPDGGGGRRPWRASRASRRSASSSSPGSCMRPTAGVVLRPLRQLLPAVRPRLLGADRRGLGRGQPHLRVPGGRVRAGRRIESRIPGRTSTPTSRSPRPSPRGSGASTTSSSSRRPSAGNAYQAPGVPRIPSSLAEAIAELESSEVAAEAFGPEVHHHLVNTARQEWASVEPGGHRLGARPQLRAHLSVAPPLRAGRTTGPGLAGRASLTRSGTLAAWIAPCTDVDLGAAPYLTASATSRSPATS